MSKQASSITSDPSDDRKVDAVLEKSIQTKFTSCGNDVEKYIDQQGGLLKDLRAMKLELANHGTKRANMKKLA